MRFSYRGPYVLLLLAVVFYVFAIAGCVETSSDGDPQTFSQLIPKPKMVMVSEGEFVIEESMIISIPSVFEEQGKVFCDLLKRGCESDFFDEFSDEAVTIYVSRLSSDSVTCKEIFLRQDKPDIDEVEGTMDAYEIRMYEDSVIMLAETPEAIAKATATFLQMLPNEFYSEKRKYWSMPLIQVKDYADFQHRGMLLDVCRHFFTVKEVKAYLEYMHRYKFNVLHWHLTEDQGWRMEIDEYPKLTEHGAWRIDPDGSRYGGFYTKDQIKEVVAYADALGITVVPEIEMPGHSQAAISAYPHLSCQQKPVPVINDWGVFKEVYCAGNDSTFLFLENVLDEVMELFPSEYIHIGGDETPKTRWEKCQKCQKRMADLGLDSEDDLQGYFIQRN